MKIAFVSSEISPYASTGGLGDVSGALPTALAARGHEVHRFMPMYRSVLESDLPVANANIQLNIPVGYYSFTADIWQLVDGSVTTWLIRRDEFFDRRFLYALPEREYEDNFSRYTFFQKAVVAVMDALNLEVDIVHCNDWQAGLMPLFLKHGIQGMGRSGHERTVFTIHNLAYQGVFPDTDFGLTNLPFSCYNVDCLEFYGHVNCMKAGLTTADAITTVSPSYAEEILTEEQGCGLEGILHQRPADIQGILNGVEYGAWDPGTDPHIAANYTLESPEGKALCKESLIRTMGLDTDLDTPLAGMVTRMVDQKGLDLLAKALPRIMEETPLSIAMLGSGQKEYQDLCLSWMKQWPGRFSAKIGFDTALAHQIEAGADLYFMPSHYEPCGLNQLYSLRYGTIPIVHAVGGLADTIEEAASDGTSGTGFRFDEYEPEAFNQAVTKALSLYGKKGWASLIQTAMSQSFSWDEPASQYGFLYGKLLQNA